MSTANMLTCPLSITSFNSHGFLVNVHFRLCVMCSAKLQPGAFTSLCDEILTRLLKRANQLL